MHTYIQFIYIYTHTYACIEMLLCYVFIIGLFGRESDIEGGWWMGRGLDMRGTPSSFWRCKKGNPMTQNNKILHVKQNKTSGNEITPLRA